MTAIGSSNAYDLTISTRFKGLTQFQKETELSVSKTPHVILGRAISEF